MSSTSEFPVDGRERWAPRMKAAGYVEVPGFEASDHAYCCFNCPAMAEDPQSPTGYTCRKFGFPDRPFGCCDGWTQKFQPKGVHDSRYGPQGSD